MTLSRCGTASRSCSLMNYRGSGSQLNDSQISNDGSTLMSAGSPPTSAQRFYLLMIAAQQSIASRLAINGNFFEVIPTYLRFELTH
mmetsp:Transcript_27422/g.31698  ORF Transcript_27422/g.31698 Transcript_27422/m.31698 type:complete len:86 (+) Transcript_27422:1104-1361(+)